MKTVFAKNCSIAIFTYNRISSVLEYLQFLEKGNFSGDFLIADGSDERNHQDLKSKCKNLKLNFNIIFANCPKKGGQSTADNMAECINQLTKLNTKKYAILSTDDDFYIPRCLDLCEKFLEKNFYNIFGVYKCVNL